MAGGTGTAVISGLVVGIVFVVLLSAFFAQANSKPIFQEEYRPRPGRIADKAVEIAVQDTRLQQLFEGRLIAIGPIRDWGVAMGPECTFGWCASILFDEISGNVTTGFAAATVGVKAGKVVDISIHKDILIEIADNTDEARYFVAKYPEAQVDVVRDRDESIVTYTITRQVGDPSEPFERKRLLAVLFDKSSLNLEPSEFRLYCLSNLLSSPAIGGDIIGRIDNEGCFGVTN